MKAQHVLSEGTATLLVQPPQLRSTNDLDFFLRMELLSIPDKARRFADALRRLGFQPVETAKYYQFVRHFEEYETPRAVKIDLLTGPPDESAGLRLENSRRVKPSDKTIALHARRTEEAVGIEDETILVSIQGLLLNGEATRGVICLPNAFSYLLMKLHAFQDKEKRGAPENASKHAADLYQILALTTEPEWETAKRLRAQHGQNPVVQTAAEIVARRFAAPNQLGILRLREYSPFFRQANATEFSLILTELFPPA